MTGMSVEISGKATVQHSEKGSNCLELVGKAAVESNDGRSLEIMGKAAVQKNFGSVDIIGRAGEQTSEGNYGRAHLVHFSWKSTCLACSAITFWCSILFVRFVYLWQQCMLTSGASSWSVARASVVLGTEIGLFVMTVLLILLIPRMIITWTTTLVFKYILGMIVLSEENDITKKLVREGSDVAREISWITLKNIFEEGNAVTAGVLVVCFTTTAFLRQMIAI